MGSVLKKFWGFFEEGTDAEFSQSSPACEPVEMVYGEIQPARTDRNFIDSHNASSFAQTATQLRDLLSRINSEKLQSQEQLRSLKSDFNERMKSLELSVEDLCRWL
ncbi:hypothetical protein F511_47346 [Dorcoceras hygrometricum]|uniref:Uncharacterized protein n=1 Tax=Dorcoceras hygrometricum TaxID=472368 RepID=A0A2Z6ZYI0_9LAMI|nr:hypothetical protein F511_47346 [Dorcoceras hygrometricum]